MDKLVNTISNSNLILFWIIVFSFAILLFLTIILFIKNRQLSKLVKEQLTNKKNKEVVLPIKEKEELPLKKEQVVEEVPKKEVEPSQIKKEEVIEEKQEEIKEEKVIKKEEPKKEVTGPYSKNVLKEMHLSDQTSPIKINNNSKKEYLENLKEELSNNLDSMDIINLEEETNFDNMYEEKYYEGLNDGNISFVEEISKRMEEEVKPQTIELTEYEQQQEDEAIISYKELMKEKEKFQNIDDEHFEDDEELDSDQEFIEKLKQFRQSL